MRNISIQYAMTGNICLFLIFNIEKCSNFRRLVYQWEEKCWQTDNECRNNSFDESSEEVDDYKSPAGRN